MMAYRFPETSDGWVKYNGNPVLGDSNTGSMFDPVVRIISNSYVMCVSNRREGTIELWDSYDGITWANQRQVISKGLRGEWDETINRGCLCLKDGKWYIWYTGQYDGKSCIGVAISDDGVKYKKNKTPVLISTEKHEGKSVMNPSVMWDDEKNIFRMWYAAGDNYEPNVICYAESKDGYSWNKPHDNITLRKNKHLWYQKDRVGGCDVIQDNGRLIMSYIGYENIDVARICFSISEDDGNTWNEYCGNPIISPSKGSWDCHAVYKPTICKSLNSEKWMLWYNGRKGHSEYIGLAQKEGMELCLK